MSIQIQKERIAYEKLWSQREKQATKLLMSTANIVGAMQGHIGAASMPRIKGLELGEDPIDELGMIAETTSQRRTGHRKPRASTAHAGDDEDSVDTPTLFA